MRTPALLFVVGLVMAVSPASGEVVESIQTGFTVNVSVPAMAPPARVYRAVTEAVGAWRDKAHTFSGDAMNLSMIATPGGCFCQTLLSGGVRHMTVIYADPAKLLRLSGGLGPLQDSAVEGTMTWRFIEDAGGTTVEVT
jgi:uncharacterized protein YndB with AHSA1/START domain